MNQHVFLFITLLSFFCSQTTLLATPLDTLARMQVYSLVEELEEKLQDPSIKEMLTKLNEASTFEEVADCREALKKALSGSDSFNDLLDALAGIKQHNLTQDEKTILRTLVETCPAMENEQWNLLISKLKDATSLEEVASIVKDLKKLQDSFYGLSLDDVENLITFFTPLDLIVCRKNLTRRHTI